MCLALGCLALSPAHADLLCFSPVARKTGDLASDHREWWEPFDYRVQVDDGPIVKPSADTSTPYEFDSERPLVKIWLGDEIVESFYVPEEALEDGRNCIVFKNLYETWSIVGRWAAERLCSCDSEENETSQDEP